MKKKYLAYPYLIWSLVFIIVPLILILYYSLTEKIDGRTVFTLKHFMEFFDFQNNSYYLVLLRSLKLAFYCTVICLLVGYPTAYCLSRLKPGMRNFLILLIVLPMWMNFLLRTYSWLTLLERNGLINKLLMMLNLPMLDILYTETAVVLGMVYNYLPFMVLPIYSVIIKIDRSLIQASEDLGANPIQTFRKVTLPLSMPGIASGITMVFMPSTTTFAISKLLGGGKVVLIGDLIEQQFNVAHNWGFGSALSVVLIVIILLTMSFMTRFEQEKDGGVLF